MNKNIKVLVVTGPTATGKTALAVNLARRFDGEIISADSRQVFRGMDIGTGKDLEDFTSPGGKSIPYHLIDIVEPVENFNLMRFCNEAATALKDISSRNKLPLFCGGTALYIDAILQGYELPGGGFDPEERERLKEKDLDELQHILSSEYPDSWKKLKDKNNPNRIIRAIEMARSPEAQVTPIAEMIKPLVIAPYYPREEVRKRIEARLDQRFKEGMIEEVETLHQNGVSWEKLEFFGLEYRSIALFLQGVISRDEMHEMLLHRIRQFAKRQDIWFRKMEREGLNIYWIREGDAEEASKLVDKFLKDEELPPPVLRLCDVFYGPKSS